MMVTEDVLNNIVDDFEAKAKSLRNDANWAIGKERERLDSQADAYQDCADRVKSKIEMLKVV